MLATMCDKALAEGQVNAAGGMQTLQGTDTMMSWHNWYNMWLAKPQSQSWGIVRLGDTHGNDTYATNA